ncbi:MAG: methyl-accepting chemotaxis protein [Planctomycetota bacterium]|jgi:PAS domain-containing protein|nr:methyl-accepting chemotaxis protein [Planctomycetota bacterium]
MRSQAFSKLKTLSLVLGLELLLALATAFLAAPAIDRDVSVRGVWLAALLFVFAAAASLLMALGWGRLFQDDAILYNLVGSMVPPAMVIDGDDCYEFINPAAERLFNLGQEKNAGKKIDPSLAAMLTGAPPNRDLLAPQLTLEIGKRQFIILEYLLPNRSGSGLNRRIGLFHDVSSLMWLKAGLREIDQAVKLLNDNAVSLSASSVTLSHGVSEQAASLSAITSGMSQVSNKIQGNSEAVVKGTQLAAQAREAAERSGNEITNALSAMTDVQDAGIRIARIVKLIDDIAFQTNLLALNAAVEAARAGRQGKGFAVVADEVRNLAGRSAKAAKDTASMVEDVTERIGNASNFISKLKEILGNIVQDAIRMANSSAAASAASAEQASGILAVNRELGQMNTSTNAIISVAEQSSAAVVLLTSQIDTLKNRFSLISRALFEDRGQPEPLFGNQIKPNINLLDDPGQPDEWKSGEQPERYQLPSSAGDFWRLANAGGGDASGNYRPQNLPERGLAGNNPGLLDKSGAAGKPAFQDPGLSVGEARAHDGDRVVRPNQHIVLDDAEFGRY